jgi:multidrug efflux pump subunit AcrB
LFGLIMVLGIVVDDAIVVGEAIYVHRKQGKTALKAAVDGVVEVGMPVIAAILTTIVAFLPLFYVGGIMGKFISILPAVVIACLVVSLVECLFLLPAHLSHLPDPNRSKDQESTLVRRLSRVQQTTSRWMEVFVARVYMPFLSKALNWRYISLATAIAVLMLTIGLGAQRDRQVRGVPQTGWIRDDRHGRISQRHAASGHPTGHPRDRSRPDALGR